MWVGQARAGWWGMGCGKRAGGHKVEGGDSRRQGRGQEANKEQRVGTVGEGGNATLAGQGQGAERHRMGGGGLRSVGGAQHSAGRWSGKQLKQQGEGWDGAQGGQVQ